MGHNASPEDPGAQPPKKRMIGWATFFPERYGEGLTPVNLHLPGREFNTTNFGAISDNSSDCTSAFANAIITCNKYVGREEVPSSSPPNGHFLAGVLN